MKVLFLCVANCIRSQMAEGLAKKILGPGVEIQSAGSYASYVHPLAIQAMNEIGIDISSHRSKSIEEINLENQDFIITLCDEQYCPTVSGGVQKIHWPFSDPYSMKSRTSDPIDPFRQIRDEIEKKLKGWSPKIT